MQIELQNISQEKKVSLELWAKYTIEKWEFAVAKYGLKHTGDLMNSFLYNVQGEADGDKMLISFAFQYYLRMIDMGVGKGTTISGRQDQYEMNRVYGKGTGTKRKRFPVYNRIFWAQMQRLSELLQEQYLSKSQKIIVYGTD